MKRVASLFTTVSFALVACSDTPTRPEVGSPLFKIADAVHGGGNEHFFWLPPMAGNPASFNGAFDGTQLPVVQICDLANCEPALIAEFTTTTGPGSETVRVNSLDEYYIVN